MGIATILVATLIAVGLLLLAALAVWRKRKDVNSAEPDYRAFYIIGLSWLPIGVALMILWARLDIAFFVGIPFLAMGLAYLAIGLANRDKWKTNR